MEKIVKLDSAYCKADKGLIDNIKPCLQYKLSHWVRGPFAKKKDTRLAYMIDGRSGIFLAGLLPRVEKYLKAQKVDYVVEEKLQEKKIIPVPPRLENLVPRNDQMKCLKAIFKNRRGIIHFPTGTGKTAIAELAITSLPDNCLRAGFFCDSLTIVETTYKRFLEHGIGDMAEVVMLGGKKKTKLPPKDEAKKVVVIGTIQSLARKYDMIEISDYFDLIIIDEAHKANSTKGRYGSFLLQSLCSYKIGLTASPHKLGKKALVQEGMLGKVIAKMSYEEAFDSKILSTPVLTLLPVKRNSSITGLRRYRDIYKQAIIESRIRNKMIVKAATQRATEGKSVLVLVNEVGHGDIIYEEMVRVASRIKDRKIKTVFLSRGLSASDKKELEEFKKKIKDLKAASASKKGGSIMKIKSARILRKTMANNRYQMLLRKEKDTKRKSDERENYRVLFEQKKIDIVITTKIWREGVDIVTLDCFINAGGGKSEIATLQGSGRPLRRTKDKTRAEIIDFLDPYKFLAEHTVLRLSVYYKLGFMKWREDEEDSV